MVRPADKVTRVRTEEPSGFEPVRSAGRSQPDVSFDGSSKPEAPKVSLAGNSLFAARGRMYRDMSPAQQAAFLSALERCKPSIVQTYGEQAFSEAERVLLEAVEFTKKIPA